MNTIDIEACKRCKLCMEICPCNVIGINGNVYFIREREHICLKCGQCMAVCSNQAIHVDGLNYEDNFSKLPCNSTNYADFINLLATRRSIRNFSNKPLTGSHINQILDSVRYAPFGASPEKMKITVINSRQKIESALPFIEEFLDNIVKWMENPVTSFMIKRKKDKETYNTIRNHIYPIAKTNNYKLENGDRITRNAPTLIIFHAMREVEEHTNNSLIYASYAMLAAHSLGLGAAMNGILPAAINKLKTVREIFNIPDENEATIALIVGNRKYAYKRIIKRNLPRVEIVNH
jgi:nitroreductase/NAD-dependent dihydropyrimidine dehydrogenase PreA subunit